jgi:nucleoporin NUP159
MIYTPSNFGVENAPSSVFNIVTRQPPSNFQFQKISEPVSPFGLNRSPPHHFLLRLRDFPPNLQDVLLVASTASADIGLFSRSKTPLAKDKPTGIFTMTELSDDSRRAQLPLTAELNDTSPIGFALDLSSKDKVLKPIPKDEIDESPTPLPGLMALNNDGVLASWWIVYSDSIRQGTIYPNLAIAGGAPPTSPAPPAPPALPTPSQPVASPFGEQAKSAFGVPSSSGQILGFGSASNIGQRKSPWSSPSTTSGNTNNTTGFGKPAFGSASTPAFGTSGFSSKTSQWGSATPANPAFGQATVMGKPLAPFGSIAPSAGTAAPSPGPFSSFASGGGFGIAKPPTESIFGAKTATSIFGGSNLASGTNSIPFGSTGKKIGETVGGLFSGAPNTFVLGSTFKTDGSAKDDPPATSDGDKGSMFGSGFGISLGEVSRPAAPETAISKDAEMDATDDTTKPEDVFKPSSTTPDSTPAPAKASFPASASNTAGNGSIFGIGRLATSSSTTKPLTSTGFDFGHTIPQGTNTGSFSFRNLSSIPAGKSEIRPTQTPLTSEALIPPVIKKEPPLDSEDERPTSHIPEAPLPPDPTSKSTFSAGYTSGSSTGTDAPLPPDFSPEIKTVPQQLPPSPKVNHFAASIPANLVPPSDVPGSFEDEGDASDFLSEDDEVEGAEESEEVETRSEEDEGSGEDVAQDISPTSEANQTPAFTPQSSFGGFHHRETDRSQFTKIDRAIQPAQSSALFGEIDRSAPVLPRPNLQSSPRSPSPVRTAIPGRFLRPETSRSVSAPSVASQLLAPPKAHTQSTFARQLEEQKASEKRNAEMIAHKEAEETQTLTDDYDDRLQQILSSDLDATRTLDEFVAHVEFSSKTSPESIPAQVETVYRDINSMIDTLGLNARALKCFVKGHTEQYKDGGCTKANLDEVEGWCLVEIDDLSSVIEKDLTRELEEGRVKEAASKLAICNDLQKDLDRLRARNDDIKKILVSHYDPRHIAIARAQALSAEQTAQQHDLRRNFTRFQKLLSEAEESLTILKAKVVSQATSNGGYSSAAGPTVEAVMRTITKMTSMAEKRSGDIDVLEGQMRKLQFGSTASIGSKEGSPFRTPSNRVSMRNPGTSSTFGLYYTPDSIKDDRRGFLNSVMSSTGSFGRSSPPRKKLSGYSAEDKQHLKSKLARKKEVADRLKATLQKTGTKVRLMDHE